jgi:hypothetical protein
MRAAPVLAAALWAAAAQADVWETLHGEWQGRGNVRGMDAEVSLVFRPALDGRAHHLAFRNAMRGEDDGEWVFLAEAIYLCETAATCRGHWYDSRGETLPLRTSLQDAALVVDWGDARTERGRTTYALQPDGRLIIRDEVQGPEGTWKVFGETSAARVVDERQPSR